MIVKESNIGGGCLSSSTSLSSQVRQFNMISKPDLFVLRLHVPGCFYFNFSRVIGPPATSSLWVRIQIFYQRFLCQEPYNSTNTFWCFQPKHLRFKSPLPTIELSNKKKKKFTVILIPSMIPIIVTVISFVGIAAEKKYASVRE